MGEKKRGRIIMFFKMRIPILAALYGCENWVKYEEQKRWNEKFSLKKGLQPQ
jgi:hypothetical protein